MRAQLVVLREELEALRAETKRHLVRAAKMLADVGIHVSPNSKEQIEAGFEDLNRRIASLRAKRNAQVEAMVTQLTGLTAEEQRALMARKNRNP